MLKKKIFVDAACRLFECHDPVAPLSVDPSLQTCKLSISSLTNTHPFVHLHVYSWHNSQCGTSRGCRRKSGRVLWISTLTACQRQTQKNKKCCTTLGILIRNKHSRHYTWYVRRRSIQITLSRWRLEHCTFQRNKHALFCIADSQRQANIKRQRGSKTCWATMSYPVDSTVHAISSLKLWNLNLI